MPMISACQVMYKPFAGLPQDGAAAGTCGFLNHSTVRVCGGVLPFYNAIRQAMAPSFAVTLPPLGQMHLRQTQTLPAYLMGLFGQHGLTESQAAALLSAAYPRTQGG